MSLGDNLLKTIIEYQSSALCCQVLNWEYFARWLMCVEEEIISGEYIWLEKVKYNVNFRLGTFYYLISCVWKFRNILVGSKQQLHMCNQIYNCKIILLGFYSLLFFFFSPSHFHIFTIHHIFHCVPKFHRNFWELYSPTPCLLESAHLSRTRVCIANRADMEMKHFWFISEFFSWSPSALQCLFRNAQHLFLLS